MFQYFSVAAGRDLSLQAGAWLLMDGGWLGSMLLALVMASECDSLMKFTNVISVGPYISITRGKALLLRGSAPPQFLFLSPGTPTASFFLCLFVPCGPIHSFFCTWRVEGDTGALVHRTIP